MLLLLLAYKFNFPNTRIAKTMNSLPNKKRKVLLTCGSISYQDQIQAANNSLQKRAKFWVGSEERIKTFVSVRCQKSVGKLPSYGEAINLQDDERRITKITKATQDYTQTKKLAIFEALGAR